jgi:hypothetical protein
MNHAEGVNLLYRLAVLIAAAIAMISCSSATRINSSPTTPPLGDPTVATQLPNEATPLPNEATSPSIPSTTAPQSGAVTYLEELDPISGYWPYKGRTISINGTSYPHSLAYYNCDGPNSIEYDLGRHFLQFTAVAGLSDRSPSGTVSGLEFLVDGRSMANLKVGRGQSIPVKLDLTDALTLKIVVTSIVEGCGDGGVALGDARVIS